MVLIKSGQLEHLNELFGRYSKRLYNYFLKSTLDKANSDDLTQELFIRVMKYRKSYREGNSFQVWIFQIARNMIKDHFRKMKVHKDQFNPIDVIPEPLDETDEVILEKERKLHVAMRMLSEEKRELLVLSKFQGLKYEQIAKIQDTSVANIKVKVHRTIKELRETYLKINEV